MSDCTRELLDRLAVTLNKLGEESETPILLGKENAIGGLMTVACASGSVVYSDEADRWYVEMR